MSQLNNNLDTLRHSTSHVLAQAVLKLFPSAKLGIGPAISDGFYYDFDLETTITEDDLSKLESIMHDIINEGQSFAHFTLDKETSLKKLQESNQTHKCELIQDLQLDTYSFYENGPFTDLCKGPHIENTNQIKAFKLLKVSGAYWKGSEENKMLQRIYGTAFFNTKDLKVYLNQLAEAKKRDHRKLGKELDLFSIKNEIGGGLILWHPKGSIMRNLIETYWKNQHIQQGYDLVYTPHIGKADLWKTSGHLDFYEENMYDKMSIENQDYYLRPMNCPFHIMIYNDSLQSYRHLPKRYAELGTVYRFERSGVLQGLFRVRGFTQDDAHIICSKDDINKEIEKALSFSLTMLKVFGFLEFELFVSTKPAEKFVGNSEQWILAENALKQALENQQLPYEIDEGGGAFYGPKIDIKIKDAIGRQWQCSTIQFDFNLPTRFNMSFINTKGIKEEPYMIHRALLGSIERFFGILIEHYAGWFPAWLAPVQCIILTINSESHDYAKNVLSELQKNNIRVDYDDSSEKIGYKIKQAISQKIPYLLIIGDQEVSDNKITIRHKKENMGSLSVTDFIEKFGPEFTSPIDNVI